MGLTILAIESSCDETAASVIINGKIVSNIIATQEIHKEYGGVVPELASRAHQQNIVPVVQKSLNDANITKSELDAVAFTRGPGLLGSLLVGASFAKAMALSLRKPLIEVNHMMAHVSSLYIEEPRPSFPYICLTVSGGHTQILKVDDPLTVTLLGQTHDDAVGEAFDKAAKLMGLPYPGGPMIDEYAKKGDPDRFSFPKTEMDGLDFSFSGIKTAILYFLRDEKAKNADFVEENINDLCASIQYTLVMMLMDKLELACKQTGIREVGIAGGVAANSALRAGLEKYKNERDWRIYIPRMEYCTDNAAMIAIAAHFKYLDGQFSDLSVSPEARFPIV